MKMADFTLSWKTLWRKSGSVEEWQGAAPFYYVLEHFMF
jgi:hypothetical protein